MGLYHYLLPLPSGYFGVSSVLYDLGGLIVIYGPAGGAWHINIEDEPRWYRGKVTVLGAGLLEMDVILGKDPVFVERIVEVANDLKRPFVAIAGTPVSAIIGVDLKGLAKAVQKRIDVPVLCINTTGAETYYEGAEKAFLALANTFVQPVANKRQNGVNILGAIHLDIGRSSHLKPLFALLEKGGWEVISCWCISTKLDDIKRAAEASLNIVVGASGISLAKFMYERFGIPYIIGIPVGEKAEKEFLALLEGKKTQDKEIKEEKTRALIIGEPVIGYSLKKFFKGELGFKEAEVVSVFPINPLFTEKKGCIGSFLERGKGDVYTTSETEIATLINQPDVDLIIADPCYERLIEGEKRFIPLPHIAMSARFYWEADYEYIGKAGGEYLKRQMELV